MKFINTYEVRIYIAGAAWQVANICRKRCMKGDLCVSVTPTTFIYNGVLEEGVIVGLMNYPRFPNTGNAIDEQAIELAWLLLEGCVQRSCSVVTPLKTYYLENPEFTKTQAGKI